MDKYVGKIFGCYKIKSLSSETTEYGHQKYIAECMFCGRIIQDKIANIKAVKTKQCPHKFTFIDMNNNISEYISNSRICGIFTTMIHRCFNKDDKDYKWYGDKGISICEEWMNNPNLFEQWSLSNGYEDDLTIDRIDETSDYTPDNCRWITREENTKWKSTTNVITVNDITDSGRGWSQRLGFSVNYINKYIRRHGVNNTVRFIESQL